MGEAGGPQSTIDALLRSELFASLGVAARRAVAAEMEPCSLPAGAVLFEEGDPGDALYVVVRGRLRAYHASPEGPVPVGETGPGGIVGELAVLSERPRFASVRAVRDTDLLRLSRRGFHDLVTRRPKALLELTHLVIDRVAGSGPARDRVRTVTLVPAGTTDPRLVRDVARALARALRRSGTVAVEGPDGTAATGLGAPDLAERLDAMEASADTLVLWTGRDAGPWTLACAAQADRVLLVADVRADPGRAAAEGAPGEARRDLLLVHPAGTEALTGTTRWLDRPHHAHHQVRFGSQQDCDRVARSLVGRSVGVVLSGGGPRGFAHLGALKAIQEAGIPIDAIGGTSIGSLMGAGVAFGWDHEATIERAARALVERKALLRPTLPLVSLSSGRRVEHLLRDPDYLGDRHMEDALVPWFCVSTSLRDARVVVHDRGPAWLAVRASIALPGILPPVYADGDLLVDGGVLDNLPVDVMGQRIDGRVVAVDLEPELDGRDHAAPFDPSVSGWQVLRQRLRRQDGGAAVPSALQVLLRSKQVSVNHLQRTVLADHPVALCLRPQLADVGALDFRAGAGLVEASYRQATEALEAADLTDLLG